MSSWHHAIARAADRKSLTTLVNDYLAMWSPAEMARLPADCRPHRIRGIEDIEYWRQLLSDAYIGGAVHGGASETFQRIIAFFTMAADRVRQLGIEDPIETGGSFARPGSAPDEQPQGD